MAFSVGKDVVSDLSLIWWHPGFKLVLYFKCH